MHDVPKTSQAVLVAFYLISSSLTLTTLCGFRYWHQIDLHHASRYGLLHQVRRLLLSGVKVDLTDIYGQTPLHKAAIGGHSRVIRVLLDYKANTARTDIHSQTALHKAVRGWKKDAVRELLQNVTKYELNAKDRYNQTPLYKAIRGGFVDITGQLLAAGASIDTIQGGKSLLHIAIHFGHIEIAKKLVAAGANVDEIDLLNYTPLHKAVLQQYFYTAKLLLDAGARTDLTPSWSPLHIAVLKNDIPLIILLLQFGSDYFLDENSNYHTALHIIRKKWHNHNENIIVEISQRGTSLPKNYPLPGNLVALWGRHEKAYTNALRKEFKKYKVPADVQNIISMMANGRKITRGSSKRPQTKTIYPSARQSKRPRTTKK